jgi:DNA-binding IclR family transcriptional regulator
MMTASYTDIQLAGEQGTIASIRLNGYSYGKSERRSGYEAVVTCIFLLVSATAFGWSAASLSRSRAEARERRALSEPLVPSSRGVPLVPFSRGVPA